MTRKLKYYRLVWLKHDLPAGLSVFLVALPLCLGIALASGAPLYAGLLSGIIGGVMVALISGSALAVSGPAAGLTTLVAASIVSLGDYKVFLLAVIIAGLFQVVLGLFKLGGIANYFPSSVIKGMLAAIGIMLISKQIPLAMGYTQPDFWSSGFLGFFSRISVTESFSQFNAHISRVALIITTVSLGILILFKKFSGKISKILPAPLVVVAAGILVNYIFSHVGHNLKQTQLVNIPDNIFSELILPDLSQLFSSGLIWKEGIIIGLLATLETLLCIEAVDKLDKRNRITPLNRELIAQGMGNITCGLLGAIPLTAVVVRGAANVDAGGKTKYAAFTHGVFLLLAVLLVPFLLNKIPYASLSAILIITGYNLAKPKLFLNMWSLGLKQFLPFVITIFMILVTDLLIGVSIGLLISVYYIIQNNFKAEYKISQTLIESTPTFYIKLNSDVTFLNKVQLRKTLDSVPEGSLLTIDGSQCNFIDYDILEIISEYRNKARNKNIELLLIDIEHVNVTAMH